MLVYARLRVPEVRALVCIASHPRIYLHHGAFAPADSSQYADMQVAVPLINSRRREII